jgi:hypothetical protein
MGRQTWVETLITSEIDGPLLGPVIGAASCLPSAARVAIPSNFFDVGMVLRIQATGTIASVPTFAAGTGGYSVLLGGNTVFDGLAVPLVIGASNRAFLLDILLTCRTIGPQASFLGQGTWSSSDLTPGVLSGNGAYTAILPWNSPPTVGGTFDSTFAQQLDLFYTKSVATGSMTVSQYTVQAID